MEDPKRTPLYDTHRKYGAKIIDFAGWAMPVQFSGILEEHHATRNEATIFDVSNMGELIIEGENALAMLQRLLTNNLAKITPGRVIYSPMCNPEGGCIDDLMVLCLAADRFMLVVNAGNIDKDFGWAKEVAKDFEGVKVLNKSAETAALAVQGPKAEQLLQPLVEHPLDKIRYFRFVDNVRIAGINASIARAGYTGEDGFEIYCDAEHAPALWDAICAAGAKPAGLGCRDTLRFEASMPLYGHELDEVRTPIEAGLSRFVGLKKPDFIGRDALVKQHQEGTEVKLIGFEMLARGVPRNGYPITRDGAEIGYVTTGSFAPTLAKNLGMGYVSADASEVGTEIEVQIRKKGVRAVVIDMPFYKRG